MKILITNDDGIFAPGIRALTEWAQKLGDVTVVAPKHEQSAKSHGINIIGEFEVKEVDFMPGVRAYSVDSTPADCIRYGIVGLGEQYDLVLSGINRGVNVGRDIVYSGTVAAIFEANCFGARAAIAMSTEFTSLERAVPHLDEIWAYFEEHKLLERHDLYNVNIPEHYTESIRITRQGGAYFSDEFVSTGENMVRQSGRMVWEDAKNFDLDCDAVMHGYISITPMTVQRTDIAMYGELAKLNS
jgi:5'-nucleotidase